MLLEIKIKGKPVNTETVKKNHSCKVHMVWEVQTLHEFRDKVRKMSFSEEKTKT